MCLCVCMPTSLACICLQVSLLLCARLCEQCPECLCVCVCACVPTSLACICLQVLLLLGYFCLMAPACQFMLQWGRENSILHRLATVPPCYFTHPQLAQVWLVALCRLC